MEKHHWGALPPLLDLTTGVFPVKKVDLEKDVVPADWKPISDLDRKVMIHCKFSRGIFEMLLTIVQDGTPEDHENAPVGLVVIGRRLEEEKVTAMLSVIAKSLGK